MITGTRLSDLPSASGEIAVAATRERLWTLISNPLLMPELSGEVQQIDWLDGATTASLGARFRGHNRHPVIGEWTTTNTVTAFEPGRAFEWTVEDVDSPAAVWSFALEADGAHTVVRETGRVGGGPSGLTLVIEQHPEHEERIVAHRLGEWDVGIERTLAGLKERAERPS